MQTTKQAGSNFEFMKRLARGLAVQFGSDCEIVVHDLRDKNSESTIIAIENGHVSNRLVGGGPSHIALETMAAKTDTSRDHLDYMTQTSDGKLIKSSSIYIRDEEGEIIGIFCINYDITRLSMAEGFLRDFLHTIPQSKAQVKIPQNVNELLDELIDSALKHVGKPVTLMKKADKIKAIQYLKNAGAFQILKSGDKVCKLFRISKFTLYNYIDAAGE